MNKFFIPSIIAGAILLNVLGCMKPQPKVEYPIRKAANKLVTLDTDMGKMTLELYRDVAPAHADSFAARAADGFYDNTVFHRIIDSFMIQGGDPKGDGTGYNLKAEFSQLPHQDGTLSMARANDPNSASTQFFICLGRNSKTAFLDGQYTVFGQLVNGFAVLHQIGKVEVVAAPWGEVSKPATPINVKKAYMSDAAGSPIR